MNVGLAGMGQTMRVASARSSAVTALVGRSLGLLVAVAFLLAALSGNSFAVHVGMTSMTSEPLAVADAASGSAGHTAAAAQDVRAAAADSAVPPGGSDLMHLMHLLGACTAVLAGAVLLLRQRLWGREPADGYLPDAAPSRLVTPNPRGAWCPPPPSPPTSSAVVRT